MDPVSKILIALNENLPLEGGRNHSAIVKPGTTILEINFWVGQMPHFCTIESQEELEDTAALLADILEYAESVKGKQNEPLSTNTCVAE